MNYTKYITVLFFSLFSFAAFSQNNDIVVKAMKEEVDRGMKEIKAKNSTPPFFISYILADKKSLSISASFGSIVYSSYAPTRMSNIRLLMGNHKCTDENFVSSSPSSGYEIYDGNPCFENSEEGLRYTIWRDIDALYKSASAKYEEKLLALKELDIPEKDKNLPDWDKSPVVKMILQPRNINFNKEKYEAYAKEASKIFNNYNNILVSKVGIEIESYYIYFYNTEGTEYRIPIDFTTLAIVASTTAKDNDEEYIAEFENWTYLSPEELPSLENLQAKCREIAEKVTKKQKAAKVSKNYTGPVLFEDYAVAETFYSNFFYGGSSFASERTPISAYGYSYNDANEEKLGEKFTDKNITIEDLTGTKEYKGTTLMGYSPIDAEGVVPPERIVLVEKGVLTNLLSGRVPTNLVAQSNGHQLYSLGGGLASQISSGVVRYSDSRAASPKKLKKELLKRAQKEGYDYAYIVRKSASGGRYPVDLYKINVKDESEELVRSATISNISSKSFKSNIVGVSNEEYIYNGYASAPISIIVPNAVLFDELEIEKEQISKYPKTSKVPAPYADNK